MFNATCFGVIVVKNGYKLLDHGTLKSALSHKGVDEMSCFFAC